MSTTNQSYSDILNEIANATIIGKDTSELKQKLAETKKTYRVCGNIDKDDENAFMNSNNRNRDDCIKFFSGSNTINYGAEEDDDWTDPEVWEKANPSLGITVDIEKVEQACESAKQNPSEENLFRQLRLNQWVKQSVR